jgi:hypothetical protein
MPTAKSGAQGSGAQSGKNTGQTLRPWIKTVFHEKSNKNMAFPAKNRLLLRAAPPARALAD